MQSWAHLPPTASPPSRGLLLDLLVPLRTGQPGRAVAAIGAVLAPSERQQFSLFFRTAYYFFRKMSKKVDPVRVPDSGPKMGPFSGPLSFVSIEP